MDRLIESIRKEYDGIIHLVVGGKDISYVEKYTNYKKLQYIQHHIGEEESRFKDVIKRAAYGYYRCLTISKNEPALIFEDDAELKEGWMKNLEEMKTFIGDEKYILSLIVPFKGAVSQADIDIPSVQQFLYYSKLDYKEPGELPSATIATYCNTTGIYYPVSMLKTRLAEFIYRFAVEDETVHDLALGHYMFRYNFPVWITVPALLKDVDTTDSSLGAEKRRLHVDYSDWDYKKE